MMLIVAKIAFALLSLFPETALQDQPLRDISKVSLIMMGTRGAPSKKQLALLQIRDAKILAEKAKLHNFWIEQKNGVFYLYPRTVIAENGFAMAGSLLDAFLLTGGRPQPVWSLPPQQRAEVLNFLNAAALDPTIRDSAMSNPNTIVWMKPIMELTFEKDGQSKSINLFDHYLSQHWTKASPRQWNMPTPEQKKLELAAIRSTIPNQFTLSYSPVPRNEKLWAHASSYYRILDERIKAEKEKLAQKPNEAFDKILSENDERVGFGKDKSAIFNELKAEFRDAIARYMMDNGGFSSLDAAKQYMSDGTVSLNPAKSGFYLFVQVPHPTEPKNAIINAWSLEIIGNRKG